MSATHRSVWEIAVWILLMVGNHAQAARLATTIGQSHDVEGVVVDAVHAPVPHAVVYVYSAGLLQGYATVCPTCWADCGKHTDTDANGHFRLEALDDRLRFRLLVVKDGYESAQVAKVSPAAGMALQIALTPGAAPSPGDQTFGGRLVGPEGLPVVGALVEPTGAELPDGGEMVGRLPGLPLLAVSNDAGEFRLTAHGQVAFRSLGVMLSPRGLAPRSVDLRPDQTSEPIPMSAGDTVIGRLVDAHGRPVPDKEVELGPYLSDRAADYQPQRVGTAGDGTFAFTNIPTAHVWRVYPTQSVESLHETAPARWCETSDQDNKTVRVGTLKMQRGLLLQGHVQADGNPAIRGLTVALADDRFTGTNRVVSVAADGTFRFSDLIPGPYTLRVGSSSGMPGRAFDVLLSHDRRDVVLRVAPSQTAR